jgi:hypothetical protein
MPSLMTRNEGIELAGGAENTRRSSSRVAETQGLEPVTTPYVQRRVCMMWVCVRRVYVD